MKTLVITGGTRGIGRAVVERFIANNFKVYILARNFSDFDIRNENIVKLQADLRNLENLPAVISEIGTVDVLVNNAGIMNTATPEDYGEARKKEILAVNLEAPIILMQECAKKMINGGKIVNNASIAGQIGHPDIWYGITKAGLINVTKSFARIYAAKKITVTAIAAGPVETQMLATIPEPRKVIIRQTSAHQRFATPEEIATAIYWLGTDVPEYMTGVCLDINDMSFPR